MFDDLLSATYKIGADGPDQYDCFTLSREVLRRVGIPLPKWESIADLTLREESVSEKKSYFTELQEPEKYCLIVLVVRHRFHIGVVLEDCKSFIHINEQVTAIERIDKWGKLIDGFYKYNNH